MVTRRRAIAILAACLTGPAQAYAQEEWRGRAMGADARIFLSRPPVGNSFRLFKKVEQIIEGVERCFSLHIESELTRLNATGVLRHPSQVMQSILDLSRRVNLATDGAFDPTIQPLWLALARGEDGVRERRLIGWDKISVMRDGVKLPPYFQLTLNGIAQGFCADKVADYLRREGFDHVLVDTGELLTLGPQANGSDWPVSITGPDGTVIGQSRLANRAIATSSPRGLQFANGGTHILNPNGSAARWNTVSISAPSAAVADALSTAACLLERDAIDRALAQFPDARLEAIA